MNYTNKEDVRHAQEEGIVCGFFDLYQRERKRKKDSRHTGLAARTIEGQTGRKGSTALWEDTYS